ncbi:hypothetical protein [Fodinibius salsisoli]|uniref:AAA+ ATPase domain-containing protein n=1 Tax=Fodinibius salsisoli TaxID=2820877 RepID=A0ABT3PSP9_9BACT|nr:hypothetical protein [Fodinibius salsisoli]MCW9708898.1 hypothetical protein [Fodinibius salsisoli]
MDRQSVIQALDTALQQKIVSCFDELIKKYDGYYEQFAQSLSVLPEQDSEEDIEAELAHLFEDVSTFLKVQQLTTFTRCFMDGTREAVAEVPETVEWQTETPLRKEVQYILADSEMIADLLREFKQQQLPFLMRLEKELAPFLQEGRDEQVQLAVDYASVAELLQKQRAFMEGPFREKLKEKIASMHTSVAAQLREDTKVWKKSKAGQAEKQWSLMGQKLKRIEKQWHEPQELLAERGENILSFLKLKRELREHRIDFLKDMAALFQEQLYLPLQQFRQTLIEAVFDIRKGGGKRSYEYISALKQKLLKYISHHLEGPFRKMRDREQLSQKVEKFSEQLLFRITQTPEQMSFIFNLPREEQPSAEDLKQIEWRLLLLRIFRQQIINEIKPSKQEYDHFITNIIEAITELKEILDVNLEASLEHKEEDEEGDPGQVATEALERIIKRLGHLTLILQNEYDSIETVIKGAEEQFIESVEACFNAKSANELQLFITQYRVKETTSDWQNIAHTKARRSKDKLSLWYRFVRLRLHGYIKEVTHFFGYGDVAVEEAKRADIISYLSETDQKIQELPYIYRRLFDFNQAVDQRFYIPVVESTATFKKAYDQWQNSPSALAVVGEKGSGKSTFLQLMRDELTAGEPLYEMEIAQTIWTEEELAALVCRELNIEEQNSVDGIIEILQQEKERRIIIFESIQNSFVRNINGYEAIEKLCYLISETKNDVFWIVSCSRYGWHFLDKVHKLGEYFSQTIQVDTLDAGDIEKMIMSRHRSSGYMLQFEDNPDSPKSRSAKKMTEKEEQQNLRKEYFKKLTEFADGNASIAIIFWIRSIRTVDENCIYIKPLEITSVEIIADLSPEVLFVLAAFVIQDTISDKDLAMILNMSLSESRLMLKRLSTRGLLLEKEGHYMLNHLVYRQIVRVLKERNIIHLVE